MSEDIEIKGNTNPLEIPNLPVTSILSQGQGAAFDDCSPVSSPKSISVFADQLGSQNNIHSLFNEKPEEQLNE